MDLVIATGTQYSVRDFINEASPHFGFEVEWRGEGINEMAFDTKSGKQLIGVSEKYYRPAEVETLLGDASKAKEMLGWSPKITFKELVKEMCESDLENEKRNN
jgi:GDPmannose 4,6-dehydratase